MKAFKVFFLLCCSERIIYSGRRCPRLENGEEGLLAEESINVLLIAKQETFKLLKRFSIAIIIYCRKSLGLAGPFLGEGFCCFSFIALPIKLGVLFIIPISITYRIWSLKNEI